MTDYQAVPVSASAESVRVSPAEHGFDLAPSPAAALFPETRSFHSSWSGESANTEKAPSNAVSFDTASAHAPLIEAEPEPKHYHPPRWPINPSNIKTSTLSRIADITVDLIVLLLSVTFLAFALIVLYYDQAVADHHPRMTGMLLEATKYGPSVFPILFACVLGRATHAILLWRLETGEKVGLLDLLAGSTSLTSTVTSQLKLKMISSAGVALILIWALSPLGGQASVRLVAIGSKYLTGPVTFTYMVPGADMRVYQDSYRTTFFSMINALFIALLLSPKEAKSSTVDTWGNLKIPMIETYEKISHETPIDGWLNTNSSQPVYSSLVGVPMTGFNETLAYYEMSMETSYLHLDCPLIYGEFIVPPNSNSTAYETTVGTGASIWMTDTTDRTRAEPDKLAPMNFTYQSWGSTGRSQCGVTAVYVEVQVSCNTSSTCNVSRIRRSKLAHNPSAWTLLDATFGTWSTFAFNFATSVVGHPAATTVVQEYLINTNDPLGQTIASIADFPGKQDASQTRILTQDYEIRLGQLLNTYWTCMNALRAITGGMTPNTAYMAGTNLTARDPFFTNSSTTIGSITTSTEVIQSHLGWVITLSIASTVMIIASLFPPTIRFFFTRGPDIMLNFSSLATRNNSYFELPSSGTYMDSSDRARLLKNMRVRLGDVGTDSEIGTLAIGSVGAGENHTLGRVRRDRMYE